MRLGTRPFAGFAAPVAALMVAGVWWASLEARPDVLEARAQVVGDADSDGLPDAQERVLGSDPLRRDSDGDGMSDLEELARQTSLAHAQSVPLVNQSLSVGISCYGGTTRLQVLVAVWASDGMLRNKRLDIGYQAPNGQLVPLSSSFLAQNSISTMHGSSSAGARIAIVDVALDPRIVHTLGSVTLFARVGVSGSCVLSSAATVDVLSIAGMLAVRLPEPSAQTAEGPHSPAGAKSGSIYVPLPIGTGGGNEDSSVPDTWIAGAVCLQRTAPVGFSGAAVTQEVVAAQCQEGLDGYCPPTCASSVGTTFQTIDPLVLLGG